MTSLVDLVSSSDEDTPSVKRQKQSESSSVPSTEDEDEDFEQLPPKKTHVQFNKHENQVKLEFGQSKVELRKQMSGIRVEHDVGHGELFGNQKKLNGNLTKLECGNQGRNQGKLNYEKQVNGNQGGSQGKLEFLKHLNGSQGGNQGKLESGNQMSGNQGGYQGKLNGNLAKQEVWELNGNQMSGNQGGYQGKLNGNLAKQEVGELNGNQGANQGIAELGRGKKEFGTQVNGYRGKQKFEQGISNVNLVNQEFGEFNGNRGKQADADQGKQESGREDVEFEQRKHGNGMDFLLAVKCGLEDETRPNRLNSAVTSSSTQTRLSLARSISAENRLDKEEEEEENSKSNRSSSAMRLYSTGNKDYVDDGRAVAGTKKLSRRRIVLSDDEEEEEDELKSNEPPSRGTTIITSEDEEGEEKEALKSNEPSLSGNIITSDEESEDEEEKLKSNKSSSRGGVITSEEEEEEAEEAEEGLEETNTLSRGRVIASEDDHDENNAAPEPSAHTRNLSTASSSADFIVDPNEEYYFDEYEYGGNLGGMATGYDENEEYEEFEEQDLAVVVAISASAQADDNFDEPDAVKQNQLSKEIQSLDRDQREKEQELVAVQAELQRIRAKKEALKSELSSISRNGAKNKSWSSESFPHSQALRQVLQSQFGFTQFRDLQLQVMNATICGRDCFVVLPTGSGKSLLFQLPAAVQGGLTLVVSPLLSLSCDQVMNLKANGMDGAMISSAQSVEEVKAVYDRLYHFDGSCYLLYVTPEMVAQSNRLMSALEAVHRKGFFTRLVIDETHCCSTMGHDFRPDYQKLFVLKRQFQDVPLLCVTATATVQVEEDVRRVLLEEAGVDNSDWLVFRASFNRTNLFYQVVEKLEGVGFLMQLAEFVNVRFANDCGIVYCFSRKDTEAIAEALRKTGCKAAAYHGSIPTATKKKTHEQWKSGIVRVVVATTAFGMGIDKPNVRFVIHATMSTSIEGYAQESGRAGRDGNTATCVLMYRRADITRISRLIADKKNGNEKLMEMVRYCEEAKECRRVTMGTSFGEKFDAKRCNASCDNCHVLNGPGSGSQDSVEVTLPVLIDCSLQAENMLRRFLRVRASGSSVTMTQLIDAWRGTGKQAHLGEKFKCPKGWLRAECEQLVVQMLIARVFKISWSYTSHGANTYLEKGETAQDLCRQKKPGAVRVAYYVRVSSSSVEEGKNGGGDVGGDSGRKRVKKIEAGGVAKTPAVAKVPAAAAAPALTLKKKSPKSGDISKIFRSASKLANLSNLENKNGNRMMEEIDDDNDVFEQQTTRSDGRLLLFTSASKSSPTKSSFMRPMIAVAAAPEVVTLDDDDDIEDTL